MVTFRSGNGLIFLILWILLTTVSLAIVGAVFHFPFGFRVDDTRVVNFDVSAAVFGFMLGAISGLIVGLPQWLIMRRYSQLAARWIGTLIIGIGVMHGLGDPLPTSVDLLVAILLGSILLSILQRQILRDVVTQPNIWMLASIAGWLFGYLVGMAILNASGLLLRPWTPSLGATQHAVFGTIHGIVYALVTGVAFLWLLPNQTSTSTIK